MRRDVQEIFRATPHHKQVMMFSATLAKDVRATCKKFMHNVRGRRIALLTWQPHEIYVDDETKLTLHGLQQYYVKLDEAGKNRKLNDLLDNLEFNQVRRRDVAELSSRSASSSSRSRARPSSTACCASATSPRSASTRACRKRSASRSTRCVIFGLSALTCRRSRARRTALVPTDRAGFEKRILVATDVFGRGIDVERVNVVISYDAPGDAPSYLHRVGRAGRFGTKGLGIMFVSSSADEEVLAAVQSRFEGANLPKLPALTSAPGRLA